MGIGTIGKYERLDVLGHGSSGVVYLAWDALLRRQVALKEIRADGPETERLLEEARVLERLREHPNIVRVHSVDSVDGVILIDMELVRGRNLARLLYENFGKPLPPAQCLHVALCVLDALDYAHARRIIHRDIKPANILIGADVTERPGFTVKLTDFGLAEALGTGSVAGGGGTYPYMAPEDFSEDADSDYRSDLWAVGVVLYEMLTGRRPFQVEKLRDPFAWRTAIQNGQPLRATEVNPDLPAKLDEVLLRALEKDKARRYPSAQVFADALRAAVPEAAAIAPPSGVRSTADLPPEPIRITARPPAIPVEHRENGAQAEGADSLPTIAAVPAGRVSVKERIATAERQGAEEKPHEPEVRKRGKADRKSAELAEKVVPTEQMRWWFPLFFLMCLAPPATFFLFGNTRVGETVFLMGFVATWVVTGFLSALLVLISSGARIPVAARVLCFLPILVGAVAAGLLAFFFLSRGVNTESLMMLSVAIFIPLLVLLMVNATVQNGGWKFWSVVYLLLTVGVVFLIATAR